MKTIKAECFLKDLFFLFVVAIIISPASAQLIETNVVVTVRDAPKLMGGMILGSLAELNGRNISVENTFSMTGDLLVPGTPSLILKGKPAYAGTIIGNGSNSPANYKVTLYTGSSLRYLRMRTTPATLATVAAPPPPKGTRTVYINDRSGSFWNFIQEMVQQGKSVPEIITLFNTHKVSLVGAEHSYGNAATLRNLIINAHAGMVAVPPGTYGNFTVNGGSGLVLGVAGGFLPVKYNLQKLSLHDDSTLQIVGPVILTVANGFSCSGIAGASNNPAWLQLRLAKGDLTLHKYSTLYAEVLAPKGTVTLKEKATLIGSSGSKYFVLDRGALVQWSDAITPTNPPPIATDQSIIMAENSATNITLIGFDSQEGTLTFTLLNQPAHGMLSGTPPNLIYQPATNYFGSDTFTFKVNNGIADSFTATVFLTVTQNYHLPIALSQNLTNFQNVALPFTLTGYDPEGYFLSFSILSQPLHGNLSGIAPNLIYHPVTNYLGEDSFTFCVNDGVSNSPAATININNLSALPVDHPPVVSAGPDQLIILPTNTVYLAGSVAYTLFPGTVDTVIWSKINGPGAVTFSNSSNLLTSAIFSQSGIYQLRLSANDLFLSGYDDLLITVDAPPMVTAGQTMTNFFPGTITLTGFANDDGLPTNGTLTTVWSKISGPGTVIFGKPEATNSTATFGTNGIYVLRLTADDGIATNYSDVMVEENLLPINHQPRVMGQSLATNENSALPITLAGFDSDGDNLTFSVITQPLHGTLSGIPPNLVYHPATNYTGADSFTFAASDGQTDSIPATVSITINFFLPPVISVPPQQVVAENTDFKFDTNRSIFVTDANTVTGLFQLSLSVTNGSLALASTNGLILVSGSNYSSNMVVNGLLTDINGALAGLVYSSTNNFYGSDALSIRIDDLMNGDGSLTDSKSVSILVTAITNLTADATTGTNFWVGRLQGFDSSRMRWILFLSQKDTSVTVTAPDRYTQFNFDGTFSTAVGGVSVFNLQAGVPYLGALEQLNKYSPVLASDVITNMDFQITSTNPISVYVVDFSFNDSEAFRPLPSATLGTNYIIGAYGNYQLISGGSFGSEFSITAIESNTLVTIVPSVTTSGHIAGQPYNETLGQGATYSLRHTETATGDLTGSSVMADKPVAVLAGNAYTAIPFNHGYVSGVQEQLLPVEHWDSEYVIPKLSDHTNYAVRILAAYDGTEVQLSGFSTTNMNRGQFCELFPTNDLQVIANRPVAICQYASANQTAILQFTPCMIWVPGVHQGLTDSQWTTPESVHTLSFGGIVSIQPLYTNFVNLVLPTQAFNTLRINDGLLPANATWNIVGDGQYLKVTLPITNGVYKVHCSEPVVTVNYGFLSNVAGYGAGSYGLAGPFSLPVFPLNVQVAVASPLEGTMLIADITVPVTAQIIDPQQLVTNVEFVVDETKLAEGAITNFTWTPAQAGNYKLQLIADTLTGQSVTSAPVQITVNNNFLSQGVSISSPYDGESVYVNNQTLIVLDFDDPLDAFDHAEFFANNVSLGETTNTTFNWTPSVTNDYTLSATIYDNLGAAYDATNTVTVHAILPPQPLINITSPAANSRVRAGFASYIIANLYDPGNLTTNVQFYVDGIKVSDNTIYFSWMPTLNGSHMLQAVALTSNGNSVTSTIVNVTVTEMFSPVVNLTSPTNNQFFATGNFPYFNAQATDSDGFITNLILVLDSLTLARTNIATLALPASNITPGWHEVTAEATDNDGLSGSSELVNFFIERNTNSVLPVPNLLAAKALSARQIQLSWQAVITNAPTQNILIQRWDATNLMWIEISEIPAANTNYLDSALNPETNYRYRVACTDTNENRSDYSMETNATTRTEVPNYGLIDLSTVVADSLTNLVPGGSTLTNSSLAQFDSRRTMPLGTQHAEIALGTNSTVTKEAVARFAERWPQIQLDYDPMLLSPHSILPRVGYLTGPDGSGVTVSAATAQMFDLTDPNRPLKAFLFENRGLFGFGPEEITNAMVLRNYISPDTGARTVVWQQQVGGVPVFNALFISHTTATGELASVACDFIPAPAQAADPSMVTAVLNNDALPLTSSQALEAAVVNVGDVFKTADITSQSTRQGIVRSQNYTATKGIKGIAYAALTWFPAGRQELKLAWQIIFTSKWRDEMYLSLVSAEDGKILYRRNLTADSSDATYRVYTDSSPSPMSPGWPAPNNAQPPLMDRSLVTLTALDTNASPNGWINDGDNQTMGNNVDAYLNRNDDDLPGPMHSTGNPSRVFDFSLNLAVDPSNYGDASVVQLFYWNNWMHDVLYGLGFTEETGNFQSNNFGRGGLSGDALQAEAQDGLSLNDGQHQNKTSMSTPPDGYAPMMRMYIFDGAGPARDSALDAEIILHEYTHGLSSRLIGGGAGIDARQTLGLGEGWSDFFALALLTDPMANPDAVYPVGSYVAYHDFGTSFDQNYYYGIRHYPYCTDTNKNPLTFADIDSGQASVHTGVPFNPLTGAFNSTLAGEAHSQGEVWCMMLWEMRANLIHKLGADAGNRLALQLVTDGMRFSPPNPNFVQARDAILLADRILSNDADAPEIWAAFSKRGLGYGATAPSSYTTAGVQASYSAAPALVVEQLTVQGGDGSGIIGTNSTNSLLVVVHNQGTATATQVSAQITTTTPGVQIVQSQSAYNDIPPSQSQINSIPLLIQTLPGFVVGTPIDLNVTINSAPQSTTSSQRLYTGNSGPNLPNNFNSSSAPTSGSVVPQDLTPEDLGNLEPLWMADDASCLLKAGPGKYVLWRPGADPIPMVNPNFLAHRLTRQGVVVGELTTVVVTDNFGDVFTNTVGAQWIPGQPAPTPLTTALYAYPEGSSVGQNVGLVYDSINLTGGQLTYLGSIGVYPMLHSLWDMNASGQSAGAASVYLRPPDLNGDGFISTNEVRLGTLEQHDFDVNGNLEGLQEDERTLSAGFGGVSPARQVYYNALLTSAALFGPDTDWNWLGPVNFSGGSVFSVGLLINDQGAVAGIGAAHTGNPQVDVFSPTRVFRWSASDGKFTLGAPVVQQLGLLDGGQHGFPMAMNQAGDIVGYSDMDVSNPNEFHAAFWGAATNGAQDLGTLGMAQGNSQAYAINDNQQIVGTSQKADSSSAAVLWQLNMNLNGVPFWESTDLNDPQTDTNWNIFNAVGINRNGLVLAYAQNAAGENHAVLLMQMAMAVDNNRDGQINFDDSDATTPTTPYRFWINDSREHDDDITSDGADYQIPGQSYATANYSLIRVNGRSDLVNFFPVALNLGNALRIMAPTNGYEYHLVQDDSASQLSSGNSAVKFIYTSLTTANAFDYLTNTVSTGYGTNFDEPANNADTIWVSHVPGTVLDTNWLAQIQNSGGTGIILVEGSAATTKPLWLEIWRNGKLLGATSLCLNITGVEQMFRHYNLSGYGNGSIEVDNRFDAPNEPQTNQKNLVFLHGYNVNQQQARGVESEMFKRFYWSGSKAKFYGVTWNGSQSQVPILNFTPNLQKNIVNAFLTAPAFKLFVDILPGSKIVVAHSLGNMVVLGALNDCNAQIDKYFMIDSAVPIEAVQGNATPDMNMVFPDWKPYLNRLYASYWWQLFPKDDFRYMLTWEDRLAQLHNTDVYNFYSSGEEVLREYTNGAPPSEIGATLDQVEYYFETVQPLIKGNPVGTYTWQWQEMLKGQGEFDNLIGSTHGGWGFNEQDLQYYWHVIGGDGGQEIKHLEPNLANILPVEELQTNAFFNMSVDKPLFTTNISGSTYAQVNRNRILSDAIPALTLPVGANPIPAFDAIDRNFNMSTDDIENGWPAARLSKPDGNKWHHSDFDYVAYPYTHKLFDTMVIEGDLK